MTAPRAKRRTAPFRTLEQLGAEMLQFHGGMSDPVYAAGSYYLSGKRHPSRAVEVAAEQELTKLYDHPDPTWTKKDMNGLWRAIITLTRLLEFSPASRGARQRSSRDHIATRPGGFNIYRPMFRTDGNWVSDDQSFRGVEPAKKRADAIHRDGVPSRVEEHAYNHLGQIVQRAVVYTSKAQPRTMPKRDITLRRKTSSRDAVGSPEREALLRAVGLSPERGVRYNITTSQLRQMVKSGHRIRVGRDPASRGTGPRRATKKRWTYVVEDLETGQRRDNEPTMKAAKQLAKLLSTHGGHPIAVIAVTTVNGKDEWHPQGAYYGARWRGGAHHYAPRGRR